MSAATSSRPPPPLVAEREHEAVTVAMIVAPGVYARNRMFDFFRTASAKRARARAATVRGLVPQLARATAVTVTEAGEGLWRSSQFFPRPSEAKRGGVCRTDL